MSLEQEINDLRGAIVRLTAIMEAQSKNTVTTSAASVPAVMSQTPIAPPPPVPVFTPTMKDHVPPPAPVAPPEPVMPPPPSFVAPAPVAPVSPVPFSDPKGLIEYVMGAYKALGREKGMAIGDVLVKMGAKALTDLQPAQYAEFYAAVEALK